jgi:tripartite-type tricarboxylate transporter receptor subunit TctC
MNMKIRTIVLTSLALTAALVHSGNALAQVYPSHPITLVVPYPAGGTSDVIARILAERMRVPLGQPVIIDNVGGAAGSIGVGRVARSAPDGYTLILGSLNTHVINGAIYSLSYDVLNDFEPVGLLSSSSGLLVAKHAMPADDLRGLIAWLKDNPDKASWGTQGVGGPSHVGGVLFRNLTGTHYQFVSYRGNAAAMQDLVAGQIDLMLCPPDVALPQVRAGRIKAYAVAAQRRSASAPDIPTVDEAGLPGFHSTVWAALWTSKGTPKPIVAKLNAAVLETLADPAVRSRLAELGQDVFPAEMQSPETLADYHASEVKKWWPIIKAANIKPE